MATSKGDCYFQNNDLELYCSQEKDVSKFRSSGGLKRRLTE